MRHSVAKKCLNFPKFKQIPKILLKGIRLFRERLIEHLDVRITKEPQSLYRSYLEDSRKRIDHEITEESMGYHLSDAISAGRKKYRNAREIKDLFLFIVKWSYREEEIFKIENMMDFNISLCSCLRSMFTQYARWTAQDVVNMFYQLTLTKEEMLQIKKIDKGLFDEIFRILDENDPMFYISKLQSEDCSNNKDCEKEPLLSIEEKLSESSSTNSETTNLCLQSALLSLGLAERPFEIQNTITAVKHEVTAKFPTM